MPAQEDQKNPEVHLHTSKIGKKIKGKPNKAQSKNGIPPVT